MSSEGKKKKKKGKLVVGIVVGVLAVVFIGFRIILGMGSVGAGIPVTTAHAERGDLQEKITTNGTVLSEEVKVIFSPVSGTISEVKAAAGDLVQAGDVLISYDLEKMESSIRQSGLQRDRSEAVYNSAAKTDSRNRQKKKEATAKLEVLNQQIADTKTYISNLQNELNVNQRDSNNAIVKETANQNNRLKQLQEELAALEGLAKNPEGLPADYAEQLAAKKKEIEDVNTVMTNLEIARNNVSNNDYVTETQKKISDAQEQLTQYEKDKAEMESQLTGSENAIQDSYTKQQQEIDKELSELSYQDTLAEYEKAKAGIVADFDGIITECNAVAGAGVTSGMQLLTLQSSDRLKISFRASKNEVAKLELGQKADVTISGKTYQGEISKINRMAEANSSGTPMVGVEIHLPETGDSIILGMDARITVYTRKTEAALLVPVEVINADRDGDFLYVAENGIAVRKPIVCGISTDQYTEILEGISEEDEIIISSVGSVEEGMAVTVLGGSAEQ